LRETYGGLFVGGGFFLKRGLSSLSQRDPAARKRRVSFSNNTNQRSLKNGNNILVSRASLADQQDSHAGREMQSSDSEFVKLEGHFQTRLAEYLGNDSIMCGSDCPVRPQR